MTTPTSKQRAAIRANREAYAQKRKQGDAVRIEANRAALAKGPGEVELPPYRIGIDPAFRRGGIGVCVIAPDGTVTFPRFGVKAHGRGVWELGDWIRFDAPANAVVFIEDSNLQNATFDRTGNHNVQARKSRNAGCNQAVSALIVERARARWGEAVHAVSPYDKGAKRTKELTRAIAQSAGHELPAKFRQDDADAYQLAGRVL